MNPRIYVDHNASTPLLRAAADAMRAQLATAQANPGSIHREGQAARSAVEGARASVARRLGVSGGRVVLTSGATEANNLVLHDPPAGTILLMRIEHPSVLEPVARLGRSGRPVEFVPNDALGRPDVDWIGARVASGGVGIVCMAAANGELGNLNPVEAVAEACRAHEVALHVDAAQRFGRLAWAPPTGVTSVTLSGHKFGGPQGTGALWAAAPEELTPLVRGGGQERGLRSGTENVVGLVGLGAACDATDPAAWQALAPVRDAFENTLREQLGAVPNGDTGARLPNTANVSFPGASFEEIVMALDLDGVACSAGSACAAGSVEVSPVIAALGIGDVRERSAVRFSFGPGADRALGEEVAERVVRVVRRCTASAGRA